MSRLVSFPTRFAFTLMRHDVDENDLNPSISQTLLMLTWLCQPVFLSCTTTNVLQSKSMKLSVQMSICFYLLLG